MFEMTVLGVLAAASVDGLPIFDYSAQTLLGIAVLMILLGWLVPKATMKPLREENAYLKSALETLQTAHNETVRQNGELMEVNQLIRSVFTALGEASK